MSFVSPWILVGIVAIGFPIWIHLFRQRREALAFPAVDILAKVAKRHRPRLKWRSIILLSLRVLTIIAVVLAASKPGISVIRPGGIRAGSALALVVLMDDSLSMRLEGKDGRSIFERAKALAVIELNRLRPGDAACVIMAGHPARPMSQQLSFDLERAKNDVRGADASYRSGDIAGGLALANRMLVDSPLPQREVVLITDLADDRLGTSGDSPLSDGIGFRVLDAGPEVQRANVALDEVTVDPSPEGVAQEIVVTARVANHGPRPLKNKEIILEVDGAEVARGGVDVAGHGTAVKRFYHRFEVEGLHAGQVKIAADRLSADNVRHFAAMVRRSISVLIIDGDYRPGSYQDEAFYLRRALKTPMPKEIPIRTVVLDAQAAQAAPLAGYDVTFLVGLPELDAELAKRLIEYVRTGGGLFVAPGPGSSGLEQLESILPARLRSVKQAARKQRPLKVRRINRHHPIFAPFSSNPSGLKGTVVSTHLIVEPEPTRKRTTLIELNNRLPLLLEREVEKGTVMLLTTSVDRDWTDLPIRPGYLPLMQRATRHLAGRLDDRDLRRIKVGESVQMEVSRGMQRLVIRHPSGADSVYTAGQLADLTTLDFTETQLPGRYRVWAEIPQFGGMEQITGLEFIVETDPLESDPGRRLKVKGGGQQSVQFTPVKGQFPIWPYLLVLAMLFVLAETAVAGYGLRRSHRE